ncbi:hypothetical protein D3C78_1984350 [compost metagenome]
MQCASEAPGALAHNVQAVVPWRLAGIADANPVIADIHSMDAFRGGGAADGDLAGLRMFNGVQHRLTHNLQ